MVVRVFNICVNGGDPSWVGYVTVPAMSVLTKRLLEDTSVTSNMDVGSDIKQPQVHGDEGSIVPHSFLASALQSGAWFQV